MEVRRDSAYLSLVALFTYIDWIPTRPGPVNRFTVKLKPAAKSPLDSLSTTVSILTMRILVKPSARLDIDRLPGSKYLFEDVSIPMQPEHALLGVSTKLVDEKTGLAEQH